MRIAPEKLSFAHLVVGCAIILSLDAGAVDVMNNIAGTGSAGFSGDGGPAISAKIKRTEDVVEDSAGNIYFCDGGNNRIRRIDASTKNITTVAGITTAGYGGDNGPGTAALLNNPLSLAFDSKGNLYIADYANNRVRMLAPDGTITTVAGNGQVFSAAGNGDNGPAVNAIINSPLGVAIDPIDGSLFVSEPDAIRRVDPTTKNIAPYCGNYTIGFAGDNQSALNAQVGYPSSIRFDSSGNLIFVDSRNQRVRMVTRTTGIVSTIAGTGTAGFSGDGGQASAATFQFGLGDGFMALDTKNNIYIADPGNNRIRFIDHTSLNISTIAGNGTAGFNGDGLDPLASNLNHPEGVFVESNGNFLISDYSNSYLRYVTRNAQSLAINGVSPNTAVQGPTTVTLQGSGFKITDSVKFSLSGQPDVTGTVQSVGTGAVTSVVSADLTKAVAGVYSIVVTPATGAPQTLAAAFTVTVPLSLTAVSPTSVGQGIVNLALQGTSFKSTDSVKLTLAGQPNITGVVKSVSADFKTSTVSFDLTKAVAGVYSIVVTPASGTAQSLSSALTITSAVQLSLTGITPTSVSTAPATITLQGSGFSATDAVKLTLAGQPDIVGAVQSIGSGATTSVVSFDLSKAVAGSYDIVLTPVSGSAQTLAKALSVLVPVTLTGVTPAVVATNTITFTLQGTGFLLTDFVRLSMNGQDLVGTVKSIGAGGSTSTVEFSLQIAAIGVYDVILTPRGGATLSLPKAVTITQQVLLTGVSPATIGKGLASITLQGTFLLPSDSVKLSMAGQPDIFGVVQSVGTGGTFSKVAFALSNAAAGVYDIVLTPVVGLPKTLPAALTVTDFGPPLLSVTLGGYISLRSGFVQQYYAIVENYGLSDALGSELTIEYPAYLTAAVLSPLSSVNSFFPGVDSTDQTQISADVSDGTEKTLVVSVPLVRSGEKIVFNFSLMAPVGTNLTHRTCDLSASISPPYMIINPASKLTSPAQLTADDIVPGADSYSAFAVGPAALAQAFVKLGPPFTTTAYLQNLFTNLGLGTPPADAQAAARMAFFRLRSLECASAYLKTSVSPARYLDDALITDKNALLTLEMDQFSGFGIPNQALLDHQKARDVINEAYRAILKMLLKYGDTKVEYFTTAYDLSPEKLQQLIDQGKRRLHIQILASHDPNDKQGVLGFSDAHLIPQTQQLSYTILFENQPSATAPAQVVTVTDTLDSSKVDLATLQFGAVTFAGHVLTPVSGLQSYHARADLRPEKNLILDIQADLDKPTSKLTWTFTSLDPATLKLTTDPVAGFLDPDVTAPQGEGSVSFTINMASGDAIGTTITNGASIVFDKNAPILTPVWSNTVASFQTLPLTSLNLKLNFAQAGSDSFSLGGTLPLPATTKLSGKTALLYVSGYNGSFVLDAKGASTSDKTQSFAIKLGKGSAAKFSAKVSGDLASLFGADGLTGGADIKVPKTSNRTTDVALVLDNVVYQAKANLIYSAKADKSGAAKMAKPTTSKQSVLNTKF